MIVKNRVILIVIIILAVFFGFFIYTSEKNPESVFSRFPFKLGLDLAGGTHLVYRADLSGVKVQDKSDSLNGLRDVIERRINIFGVSEPLVQIEKRRENDVSVGRLIVELPGVTNVDEATKLIGETPVLDFRSENPKIDFTKIILDQKTGGATLDDKLLTYDDLYIKSALSGKDIKRAQVQFDNLTGEPYISLVFTSEGAKLFQKVTKENIGKTLAIFLDGAPIQTPTVQQEISGGQAQITGRYTLDEAKILVGRLNAGALPVPISLLGAQTIGASLGHDAVEKGINAGIWGFVVVVLFFVLWYRVPGALAAISLSFYVLTMFTIFKLIPITLTSAGIAGFILSIGLAVDANVLIFERLKEERKNKDNFIDAIPEAFSRAWPSIRDANATSILIAIILFWSGTSLIKGFALTFGLGVLVSMFSSIVFTKALLVSINVKKAGALFGSGFKK